VYYGSVITTACNNSLKVPMKPGNASSQPVRLLDQVREHLRYLHYSVSTEKTYLP
jgi:hypothetical protein